MVKRTIIIRTTTVADIRTGQPPKKRESDRRATAQLLQLKEKASVWTTKRGETSPGREPPTPAT